MKHKRPPSSTTENSKNVSERRNKIRNLTGKFKSYGHLLYIVEDGQAKAVALLDEDNKLRNLETNPFSKRNNSAFLQKKISARDNTPSMLDDD